MLLLCTCQDNLVGIGVVIAILVVVQPFVHSICMGVWFAR